MDVVLIGLLIISGLLIASFFALRGEDLSRYDRTPAPPLLHAPEPSAEHAETVRLLAQMQSERGPLKGKALLKAMRANMDAFGDDADLSDLTLQQTNVDGVPAEWVYGHDRIPGRRLLYIHGGAFALGSPRSHRRITTALARMNRCEVLAIDYRLMPEHRRLDCLTDCQSAYRWLLDHGPEGRSPVKQLFVAGDSAGGSLTLAVIAWARDEGLRAANAAVALSPSTDNTLSSPSMRHNLATDYMLAPMLGKIVRLPRALWLWMSVFAARTHPCDPRISPLHGDLSGLPPTLIHASEAEMLLDDARRYVNKATDAGSPVNLETWHHVVHVWHIFEGHLPEANEAFDHITRFLELNAPVVE